MNKSKAIKISDNERDLLKEFIFSLEKEDKCAQFLDILDWKKLKLFDYRKVVTKQIYLNLVKKNIEKYKLLSKFIYDIRMIWKNYKKYFGVNTEIYKNADYMEKLTNNLYQKLLSKIVNSSTKKDDFNQTSFSIDTLSTLDEKSVESEGFICKETICQEEKNFIKEELEKLNRKELSHLSNLIII